MRHSIEVVNQLSELHSYIFHCWRYLSLKDEKVTMYFLLISLKYVIEIVMTQRAIVTFSLLDYISLIIVLLIKVI